MKSAYNSNHSSFSLPACTSYRSAVNPPPLQLADEPLPDMYTTTPNIHHAAVQFCWSPKDPTQCSVVTDKGHLLLGHLGEPLRPVDTYSSVTCAFWSPDGQLLAIATGQQVHIYNAAQGTACFDSKVEHQVGCSILYSVQLEASLLLTNDSCILQPVPALWPAKLSACCVNSGCGYSASASCLSIAQATIIANSTMSLACWPPPGGWFAC